MGVGDPAPPPSPHDFSPYSRQHTADSFPSADGDPLPLPPCPSQFIHPIHSVSSTLSPPAGTPAYHGAVTSDPSAPTAAPVHHTPASPLDESYPRVHINLYAAPTAPPIRFLYDTGASCSIVTPSAFAIINRFQKPRPAVQLGTIANASGQPMRVYA